jgi:hypothetical protein
MQSLETTIHEYAKSKATSARARWLDKQISDDFAYTNGSADSYKSAIHYWESLEGFIAERYSLERDPAARTRPASLETMTEHYFRWLKTAEKRVEELEKFEEEHEKTLDSFHRQQWKWLENQADEAKSRANLHAFLIGITHPFPGIDMLEEEPPMPVARTSSGAATR